MAEVKLSVTGKNTITYMDNAALITASIAPPSMTFVEQTPQVTMKDPIVVMTYTEKTQVNLEYPTERDIENTVEIDGRIERIVDSYDPFKVTLKGDIERSITNSVELEYQLEREVLSFNVGLEYGIRREVTNSVDLEGNLTREVKAKIQLLGSTARIVKSDEDAEQGVPTKEYGSFIDKNKLFRVQHDVLDEDVSDNPYFNKEISNLQNAALLTKNQTVIKAINELFVNQREIFMTTFNAVQKFNTQLGDLVENPELNQKFQKLGVGSIIEGLISLSDNIDTIIEFIHGQSEELDEFNELGYKNLIDGLIKINKSIKEISYDWDDMNQEEAEWIFGNKDYIPEIKDTVFRLLDEMDDKIKILEYNISQKFIELKNATDQKCANVYQALIDKYNDVDDATREEIRSIFYYLQEDEAMEESEDAVVKLVVELGYQIADHKREVQQALDTMSEDLRNASDATEEEIKKIFGTLAKEEFEDDTFEAAITRLFNELDTRVRSLEQENQSILNDLVDQLNAWEDITQDQIRDLFNTTLVDEEEFEDKLIALLGAVDDLTRRLGTLEQKHDQDIEDLRSGLVGLENVTSEEIQNIFSNLTYTTQTSVEEVLIEEINGIKTQIDSIKQDLSTFSSDDEFIDLTNENVQDIFGNTDEEDDFYTTIVSLVGDLKDRILNNENTMNDRLLAMDRRVTSLEEHREMISRGFDELTRYIAAVFSQWIDVSELDIRRIFDALEDNPEEPGIDIQTYAALVTYLNEQLAAVKKSIKELDNRVTVLELRTDPYIASEEDIYNLFPDYDPTTRPDFNIDDYPIATEDQIEDLFTDTTTTHSTIESSIVSEEDIYDMFGTIKEEANIDVEAILNNIASEEDIYHLFGLEKGTINSTKTMAELLTTIANSNGK